MLGIPQHALRRSNTTQTPPDWWTRSTPAYLAGYIAYELLHMPVTDYLRLPKSERQFTRAYLIARSLKQQRGQSQSQQDQQHAHWHATWKQQYGHHSMQR